MAASTAFSHLEYLKLKNCGLGNTGLTAILSSYGFRRLKVLIVSKNQITKVEAPDESTYSKAALKREVMELSLLDLRENQITTQIK